MADSSTSTRTFHSMRSPTFAALGQPGFRRFYIGQGISLVGSWLQGRRSSLAGLRADTV